MRKFTNIFRTKRKNNISLILSALCLMMAASCLSAHESNAVESHCKATLSTSSTKPSTPEKSR